MFRFGVPVLLGLVLAVLCVGGMFDGLNDRWGDTLQRVRGMRQADPRVLVVYLDGAPFAAKGSIPWPRKKIAELVDRLKGLGVKTIGLDLFFTEKDPANDPPLAQALRRAGNVFLADTFDRDSPVNLWRPRELVPELLKASAGVGLAQIIIDPDGIVRAVPLMAGTRRGEYQSDADILADRDRIPALGVAMLAAYQGRSPDSYLKEHGQIVMLNFPGSVTRQEHTSAGILTVERLSQGVARVAAIDVLEDRLTPDVRKSLRDSLVLVGVVSPASTDHFPTTFDPATPGVDLHAALIDNLLQGRELRQAQPWVPALLTLLFALLPILLVDIDTKVSAGLAVGLLAAWAATSYLLFRNNLLFGASGPAIGFCLSYVVLMAHKLHRLTSTRPS